MRIAIVMLVVGGCGHVVKTYDSESSTRRLAELGESPLRGRSSRTMYRTFVSTDRGYVISFERKHGEVVVRAVTTDGDELYSSTVPNELWRELTRRIIASGFWGLPREGTPRSAGIVLHGDCCEVEGMLSGNYHAIERGNLDTTPAFSEVCNYFFTSISLPSPFSESFLRAIDPPHAKTTWELDYE